MQLYLIQHGQALSEEKDPKRPLSPEGIEAVKKVARFLNERDIQINQIWHSKKLRAIQTAEIIAQGIKTTKLIARDDLNPNDPVSQFPAELSLLNTNIILVSHLPFLQKLSSMLLTGTDTNGLIAFQFSGIVALEYQTRWKISWIILPELI